MVIDAKKTSDSRLQFFQNLYEMAKNANDDHIKGLERNKKQYDGDATIDGSWEAATVVRNITYELIESEVSTYIPRSVVSPEIYSERNDRCAKSIETLCNKLRNKIPLEVLNDIDERMTYVFGSSIWLVEWDESIKTHNTVGDVSLKVLSPEDFVPQPGVEHVEDMEYCFIKYNATTDDVSRMFGVEVSVAEQGVNEDYADTEDVITVITCFYKDEEGNVCKYVWSDDVELQDVEDYYARRKKVCRYCGRREEICLCDGTKDSDYVTEEDDVEELTVNIVTANNDVIPAQSPKVRKGEIVTKKVVQPISDEYGTPMLTEVGLPKEEEVMVPVMQATKIPYYKPKRLPVVIRRNTAKIGSLWGESDCARMRHQQQAINKVESRIMAKLMKAGVTPYVPEDTEVAMNNSIFGTVLKLKPGSTARDYGTIDTTPAIAQDVAEADRLYDQAKRILGISDSFQGQYDGSAQSGYAKQLQISQSSGRLQSKRALKHALYADLDRAIFELYLAFADEPRPLPYKDEFGRIHNMTFNRYDFVRSDNMGNYYYTDQFLFSADASIDPEEDRQSMWSANLSNLQQGTFGNPQDPATMVRYWSAQEKAHYPHARDNVEYFTEQYKKLMAQAQMQVAEEQAAQAQMAQIAQMAQNQQGGM